MPIQAYSAVSQFFGTIVGVNLEGWAAPDRGRAPCQVSLYSGDIPIAFCRATRFSSEAEHEGVRLGWCGFALPALDQALALGGPVAVRCEVSGKVLMRPDLTPRVFNNSHKSPDLMSVFEALEYLRKQESCPDAERLAVFGRNHLRRHGAHSFLNALFRSLLSRDADTEVLQLWRHDRRGADAVLPLISQSSWPSHRDSFPAFSRTALHLTMICSVKTRTAFGQDC